jgi:hypothetical protein
VHWTKRIGCAEAHRARTGAKPDTSVEEPLMLRSVVRCRMSEAHADRCGRIKKRLAVTGRGASAAGLPSSRGLCQAAPRRSRAPRRTSASFRALVRRFCDSPLSRVSVLPSAPWAPCSAPFGTATQSSSVMPSNCPNGRVDAPRNGKIPPCVTLLSGRGDLSRPVSTRRSSCGCT